MSYYLIWLGFAEFVMLTGELAHYMNKECAGNSNVSLLDTVRYKCIMPGRDRVVQPNFFTT
jgi:hypothetical protein